MNGGYGSRSDIRYGRASTGITQIRDACMKYYCITMTVGVVCFFFSSRRRHTRYIGDWSSDVCSSDLPVALEVRQGLLGEPVATVDPVHDLEGAVGLELLAARLHPAHEGGRLLGEAEAHEAVEREGGVADPGVAIVPVPLAAELLGKPEGGGRDDGAVRPRGEELEGQRGAVDHLTPAALVGGATEPPAPEVEGALEGVRDVVGRGAGRVLARPHLLEHERGRLVRAQGELGDRGAGLDAHRHRRAEMERDRMVARREEAHAVGRALGRGALARVVEARLAEHAKAYLAPRSE